MAHLSELLDELTHHHGLIALKAGTEWEDMNYDEIEHLSRAGKAPTLVMAAHGMRSKRQPLEVTIAWRAS